MYEITNLPIAFAKLICKDEFLIKSLVIFDGLLSILIKNNLKFYFFKYSDAPGPNTGIPRHAYPTSTAPYFTSIESIVP